MGGPDNSVIGVAEQQAVFCSFCHSRRIPGTWISRFHVPRNSQTLSTLIEFLAHNAFKNLAGRRSGEAVREHDGLGDFEPSNLALAPFDQLLLG